MILFDKWNDVTYPSRLSAVNVLQKGGELGGDMGQ
jgi:hypothetical protein